MSKIQTITNNYLLKRNAVIIIYPIYLQRESKKQRESYNIVGDATET